MSSRFNRLKDRMNELRFESRDKLRKFFKPLRKLFTPRAKRKLKQNWAGALSDYREVYTSLQLQQKASDWRSK